MGTPKWIHDDGNGREYASKMHLFLEKLERMHGELTPTTSTFIEKDSFIVVGNEKGYTVYPCPEGPRVAQTIVDWLHDAVAVRSHLRIARKNPNFGATAGSKSK